MSDQKVREFVDGGVVLGDGSVFVLGPDEELELVDAGAKMREFWLKHARMRGELLRYRLEKGVEWSDLEPMVRDLGRWKRDARRMLNMWVEPVVFRVRRKS